MSSKILIVEDQDDSANMLMILLTREGYTTICAQDGRQGYELAMKEKPDLVLTDIEMPDVDGVELIRMLRQEKDCAKLPIILITAYRTNRVYDAMSAGANAVTFKPIFYDTLCKTIKEWLPN